MGAFNQATPLSAYQEVGKSDLAYTDPHRLISMLMDGALDRIARARHAMQAERVAEKGELIGNAITIISGLKGCLDMDAGETLSAKIKRGPFKLQEAITIASQVADGLQAAHERDIIHRDVKSLNVMLDERGDDATTPFNNDLFLGLRWTANDEQSTELLAGVIYDWESDAKLFNLEASRRLGQDYKLSIQSRGWVDVPPDDLLLPLNRDDYLQIELARYF